MVVVVRRKRECWAGEGRCEGGWGMGGVEKAVDFDITSS